jgi:hypothetical protein
MGKLGTTAPSDFCDEWPVADMRRHGYACLPGLSHFFDELSPLIHAEAWETLGNNAVQALIAKARGTSDYFFLTDEGAIEAQPTISFAEKMEKSHLTLLEQIDGDAALRYLPRCLQEYLLKAIFFISRFRNYLEETLPVLEHPTDIKVRIFRYSSSDPLVNFRPPEARMPSMRTHVDGSVATLVISENDGRLRVKVGNCDQPVGSRSGGRFAALLPGVAALHDWRLVPTPHYVLPDTELRASLTAFLTPALGTNRDRALAQLRKWRIYRAQDAAAA